MRWDKITDDDIREMMRTPIWNFYEKYGVLCVEAFMALEDRWIALTTQTQTPPASGSPPVPDESRIDE